MMNGYDQLVEEVIDAGICVSCGNCAAVCPLQYISMEEKKPVQDREKRDEIEKRSGLACNDCNLCAMSCPRIEPTYFWQKRELKRMEHEGEVKAARTTYKPIQDVCQDGGIVTTLFKYLLDSGRVDGVVVSQYNGDYNPVPVLAKTEDDLLKAAGTRYTVSPAYSPLTDIKQLKDDGYERIAIVGTPCQIYALRKTQAIYNSQKLLIPHNIITFAIGLFCAEEFDDRILQDLEVDIADVTGFDVKKEGLIISLKSGEKKIIPHEDLEEYVREGCKICSDFNSPYADISVGSVGSPPGWSTVIVRTETGREIYQKLLEKGLIEETTVDEKGLKLIDKMAQKKINNAQTKIKERSNKESEEE